MTPEQCRAARGWLNMSPASLAEVAGIAVATVVAFEAGQPPSHQAGVAAMRDALEAAGIGFSFVLDDDGPRPCGITFTPTS